CRGTTGAERVVALHDIFPVGAKLPAVPDFLQTFVSHVAEDPRLHRVEPAAGIGAALVPEVVAGVDISVPADKGASILDEVAAPLLPGRRLRQAQLDTGLGRYFTGFGKYFVQFDAGSVVEGEQTLQIEGDAASQGIGFHRPYKGDYSLLLRGPVILPEQVEVAVDLHSCHFRLVLPDMEQGEGFVGAEVVGALAGMGLVIGEQVGDDGKGSLALRCPAQCCRQFPQVVFHDDEFDPHLKLRPPAQGFGFFHGEEGMVHAGQFTAATDGADRFCQYPVQGEADPVQPGVGQGNGPQGGQQQAVGLKTYPAAAWQERFSPADELLQMQVEQRFADAVQYQCIQPRYDRLQGSKGCRRQIAVRADAPAALLHAHEAVQVAAAGGLDEEAGRVGAQGGNVRCFIDTQLWLSFD